MAIWRHRPADPGKGNRTPQSCLERENFPDVTEMEKTIPLFPILPVPAIRSLCLHPSTDHLSWTLQNPQQLWLSFTWLSSSLWHLGPQKSGTNLFHHSSLPPSHTHLALPISPQRPSAPQAYPIPTNLLTPAPPPETISIHSKLSVFPFELLAFLHPHVISSMTALLVHCSSHLAKRNFSLISPLISFPPCFS